MIVRAARLVPVLFAYVPAEARSEGWGRFTRLAAGEAELATAFRLERGDRLVLSFEVAGEPFRDFPARVARVSRDADGYHVAELRFPGPESRLRLGRVLRDLLSRVP